MLNALWLERQLDTAQAAERIQKPEAEARSVLARLVEAGLVEAHGARKGRSYHLSARTYRRLGEKAAYVRQRGFEPLQQEQMVLQYIQAHGRITRKEAADLCQVTERQASYILEKMARMGKLMPQGERKGRHYTLKE